jgi:hypothetical protein
MKQRQQGVKENQASTTAAMLHEKEILYGKQWQVAGISKSPESARLKTEKIAFGESCSDVPVLGQVDEIRICRGFLCVANQPGFLFACARNYSALASEKRKRSSTRIKSAGKSHPINLDQKSVQATLIQIIAAKSVCITRDIRSAEEKNQQGIHGDQYPKKSSTDRFRERIKKYSAEPVQLLHVKDGQGLAHQDPKKEPCSDRFRQSPSASAEPLQLLHVKDGKGSSLKEK